MYTIIQYNGALRSEPCMRPPPTLPSPAGREREGDSFGPISMRFCIEGEQRRDTSLPPLLKGDQGGFSPEQLNADNATSYHVPISQLDRYTCCSSVRVSM